MSIAPVQQMVTVRQVTEVDEVLLSGLCTLLVLDTQAGSVAESVYRPFGWQRVGEIPDWAASPTGQRHATGYYYKRSTP